jgi:phosphotransferase system HPr (HPr) family protein
MLTENATRTVFVTNRQGLHVRVCSAIVTAVKKHRANVTIRRGSQTVDAASILDLLLLAASQGTELVLSAGGSEAEEALEAVAGLLDAKTDMAFAGY